MKKVLTVLLTLFTALAFLCSLTAVASASPVTGAIWTTDSTASRINQNIYEVKTDVFLNGGPKSNQSPGLPDGYYYVKVTSPNGTVLGSGVGGDLTATTVEVFHGRFVQVYQLWTIVRSKSTGFTAQGYDDTPNSGNEYKVWLSQNPDFPNNSSKTDNFKVLRQGCPCFICPEE